MALQFFCKNDKFESEIFPTPGLYLILGCKKCKKLMPIAPHLTKYKNKIPICQKCGGFAKAYHFEDIANAEILKTNLSCFICDKKSLEIKFVSWVKT